MPRSNAIPPEVLIHYRRLVRRPRRNANGDRLLTVASCANPDPSSDETWLPMIRIRGRWLKDLGFDRGERIAVSVEDDRLVLKLAGEK